MGTSPCVTHLPDNRIYRFIKHKIYRLIKHKMVLTRNTFILIFIIILSELSSGRSIGSIKTPNPCPVKSFCEAPSDYPAQLIRSLLENQNIPLGIFDKKERIEETKIKENYAEINKNSFGTNVQQIGDNVESEEIHEVKTRPDHNDLENGGEFYRDKLSLINEISSV